MNSHNAERQNRSEATRTAPRTGRASGVDNEIAQRLSLEDDFDIGGDPYNSTGRHVIISQKIKLEE